MDCTGIFRAAREAGRNLQLLEGEVINRVLLRLADKAEAGTPRIIEENKKDLARMDSSDPKFDRLKLSGSGIKNIASDIRKVASLPFPFDRNLYEYLRPDGMLVKCRSVPFGVIGIIYEARPNVTFDVFSLCFKSRNAIVLKGGSDAIESNSAIVALIKEVLKEFDLDEDIISLLPPGREETMQLLNARGLIDLVIPRGSQELINYVRENARIPVIETGAGVCHTYFDEYGDMGKGIKIIYNAKTRRVSVCNALDCLIIHEKRLGDLGSLVAECANSDVEMYADESAFESLKGKYPKQLLKRASHDSFGTEFLSYRMAVKTVKSINEALNHIAAFGSGHSEAIISEDPVNQEIFLRLTDASAVYVNASTAFTDGAEFGLGAEIGISTQKLHARGPMALEALTTQKWIIRGNGHTRK